MPAAEFPGPQTAGEYAVETTSMQQLPDRDALALRFMLDAPEAVLREEAVEHLGELGNGEAVEALERALLDTDPEVRAAAIAELADIPGDASALALSVALWSDDPDEREDAVDALARLGGTAAFSLLERALSDEDPYIRQLATERLAELQRQSGQRTD